MEDELKTNLDELINGVKPEETISANDFGARGADEFQGDSLLKSLNLIIDENGKAQDMGEITEDDIDKAESQKALIDAAKSKGVDIDLHLDDNKYEGALIIEKEDFLRAFNLAIPVIQSTSTVAAYKGLNIVPSVEDKTIKIVSVNGIETLTYDCAKVDFEYKMLNEKICLETSLLQKLARVIGNHILIYREKLEDGTSGNLKIRLIDGDLVLELKKIREEDLVIPGQLGEKLVEVETNRLNDILKTLIPIASDGARPQDRNIAFLGDKAYYKSSKYLVKYDINTPKFISKSLESEFLRRLCTTYKGKILGFYNVDNVEARRVGVKIDNVYYTMITATPDIIDREKELLESANSKNYMKADYTTMLRIISLAADLPKSTGAITIKAEAEDRLKIVIESRSGNSDFVCRAQIPQELVNTIQIRLFAKPLKKLLSSITAEYINIAIDQNNIFIKNGEFTAVFMNII